MLVCECVCKVTVWRAGPVADPRYARSRARCLASCDRPSIGVKRITCKSQERWRRDAKEGRKVAVKTAEERLFFPWAVCRVEKEGKALVAERTTASLRGSSSRDKAKRSGHTKEGDADRAEKKERIGGQSVKREEDEMRVRPVDRQGGYPNGVWSWDWDCAVDWMVTAKRRAQDKS
ncbi:hypothetical protein VTN77DRAFT_2013 [Rasamsonia byssochlamydoides]|uniref:uncharacterized protein n=1 Tax=Rasamsonia byssochlamydoides TaxID=89139 RepID=UPI0037442A64